MKWPWCLSVFLCSPLIFVRWLLQLPCCMSPLIFFFVFSAVRILANESRQLGLPRTSCNTILSSAALSTKCLFASGFWNKMLHAFRIATIRATCPVHLVFLYMILILMGSARFSSKAGSQFSRRDGKWKICLNRLRIFLQSASRVLRRGRIFYLKTWFQFLVLIFVF
jgi:hypothetical protein